MQTESFSILRALRGLGACHVYIRMKAEHHEAHPSCSHWSPSFGLAESIPWRTFVAEDVWTVWVWLDAARATHLSERAETQAVPLSWWMWLRVCRSFSLLKRWIIIAPNLSRRREEATETGRKLCSRSSASLFYHISLHLLGPYFLLSTTHTFTPSRSSCPSSICTLFSSFCVQESNTFSSGCFV